ncbi:MAG: MgtC/SapB family protein [Akkermansiaceae bacterium]|nr:MgtC/SapB family protein [Akkermansiaceae bacterium]
MSLAGILPETFQWSQVWNHLIHLGVAYLLALPVAYDREQSARSAGMRTFPLVGVASCGFILTGISVINTAGGHARLMQGIMTGLGFIGGGAILKNEQRVRGMATAASIWTTGAIGMAVAYRRYEIALVLALVNFISLRFGKNLLGNGNSED